MKNRVLLILAIYSVAGLLALNVHAAPDDDIVGPPKLEDQTEPNVPEEKPAPKPAPRREQKPAPREQQKPAPGQQEPGDHP